MRQQFCLMMLAVIGAALSSLPIRSQQLQRNDGIGLATISRAQAPYNPVPQQNSSSLPNPSQNASTPPSEEAPVLTVVLDPAHGGADFGARGPTGLAESDVVLDFARAARIALEAQRLRVLLTREGNQDPSFDNRSAMINGLRNAILISLHVSSGGRVGTARAYYYVFPSEARPAANAGGSATTSAEQSFSPPSSSASATAGNKLIVWDDAQRSSIDLSRQLATLAQTELVRRFRGSPESPIAASVRQLRTIAAPAIAIELSSINVTDEKRLDQMAQPLAEAIGRAVAEFHYPANAGAAPSPGAR